jgi:Holliday junction resolvase RusA-like endonuclease
MDTSAISERRAVEFWLPGDMPVKKNSKMMTRGRLITNPKAQQGLAALTMITRGIWKGRDPLTKVWLRTVFHVSSRRKDLDNIQTSLLDVLKDAGVIVDDSMAHVEALETHYVLVPKREEGVQVRISGMARE